MSLQISERGRLLNDDDDELLILRYDTTAILAHQKPRKQLFGWKSQSYIGSLSALILLFVLFTAMEYTLFKFNLPAMNPNDRDVIRFPTSLEDLRKLNEVLTVYMDKHFVNIYVNFIVTYIYLQSLSIPGSMWLSILGGTLFNFWLTLITVSMVTIIHFI
ncbi:MAG: hypothetical protein EXX96DRAFT_230635 [Benjaminiella poitrasii]|nr:MAG: hypothetical protein EXX96DRAFT_230635 [Benjaminiella poitrasii]